MQQPSDDCCGSRSVAKRFRMPTDFIVPCYHLQEIEMIHRTSAAARVSVVPSRASPSRMILLVGATLALSIAAATAGGQAAKTLAPASLPPAPPALADSGKTPADSAASTTKTAAAAAP